jgi:hypothetical protein
LIFGCLRDEAALVALVKNFTRLAVEVPLAWVKGGTFLNLDSMFVSLLMEF